MKFEDKYFVHLNFTKEQIKNNYQNALKDFGIAKKDSILEVKFNYSYTALIKAGITLLSFHNVKIKSMPGHHIKIIEKIAEILKNESIADIGNVMRSKRNLDLYAGGAEVTQKECREYIEFIEEVLKEVGQIVGKQK